MCLRIWLPYLIFFPDIIHCFHQFPSLSLLLPPDHHSLPTKTRHTHVSYICLCVQVRKQLVGVGPLLPGSLGDKHVPLMLDHLVSPTNANAVGPTSKTVNSCA